MARKPQQKPLTPQALRRLIRMKENSYGIYTNFRFGYRNKEDISTLPPNIMVIGSQNVLTNSANRIAVRKGYALDGSAADPSITEGIDSSYDFETTSGAMRNIRKWGTILGVRYVNPVTKEVSWINIMSGLDSSKIVNFTTFWDEGTEKKRFCLFVNGNNHIYEWTGAVGSVKSVSNATGIIATMSSVVSGGTGYKIDDILTLAGGTGATAKVTSVARGGVATASVALGGTGYVVGDIVTLVAGYSPKQASIKVTSIDTNGGITGLTIEDVGQGYLGSQEYNTTGGSGSGAIIMSDTVGDTVTGVILTDVGSGYTATTVATTSTGAGVNCQIVITAVGNNSITLSGNLTTSQLGFYDNSANSGKFVLVINGKQYKYTSANADFGMTFVGLSVDPTTEGIAVGDAVVQHVALGASADSSFLGSQFNIDLISTLSNQIWYGSLTQNTIFVSKTNNYKSVSSSSPRLASEGALLVADSPPVAFYPQGFQMYLSTGSDQWWVSDKKKENVVNSSVIIATELLFIERVKTTINQGAKSQAMVGSFKNSIMYMSREPIFNTLGLIKNVFTEPQITNISDPIKYDIDAYDFTDASVFYFNYMIYIAIPRENIVRIFNIQKKYWEAPQIMPISRFYIVDGELYGHSYNSPESYKLFTGHNDNGSPINCIAAFAYDNMSGGKHEALRPVLKNYNVYYTEGYISSNTKLTVTWNYDFGGSTSQQEDIISGTDKKIIFNSVGDGSLGKQSLGEYPIGSIFNSPTNIPKFRKLSTMIRQDYFEYQVVFSSNEIDQDWEIVAFGAKETIATELPTSITE